MLHSRVRRFYILSGKRIAYFYLRASLFYFYRSGLKSLYFFLDSSMCLREVSILGGPLRMGMLGLLAQLTVLISTMLLMLRYLWKYALFSIYSKLILFSTSTSRHLLISSLSYTLT